MDEIKNMVSAMKAEDLPETLRFIADEIGLEATLKLVSRFAGAVIYIPIRIKRNMMKDYIKKTFTGNYAISAARLGITERTLRNWLKNEPSKTYEQLNLFQENPATSSSKSNLKDVKKA